MKLMKSLIPAVVLSLGLATNSISATIEPASVEIKDGAVAVSLTGAPGDAKAGADTFKNGSLGNCLACHANKDMSKELFHGNVGPELDGVAGRWSPEELRAIVVNSKAVFGEETVMPGFYSLEVGKNPAEKFVGKTILTAEQVEDIIAYLATLKE